METIEEKEKRIQWWYTFRREGWKKMDCGKKNPLYRKIFGMLPEEEEAYEERNDVYLYKTLKYPPKSTPPTPST